jgi:hypothetical protein
LPENGQLGNGFTDTLTVRLSTVLLDSATTANTGQLLVGRTTDPELGPLEARSYLRMGAFDSLGYSLFNRFDSLVVLTRLTYVSGDTTRPQRINVYRLNAPVESQRQYQASDQIPFSSPPVGSVVISPRVLSGTLPSDTVKIRLDDALGQAILARAGQPETFKQNFPDWFRGLVLVPDPANTAVLGFGALAVGQNFSVPAAMNLYYHREEPGRTRERFFATWAPYSTLGVPDGWSFNGLITSRPGVLGTIKPGQPLPSAMTKGLAYAQGNTGLTALITLPYLDQFRNTLTGVRTVNRVELTLEPGALPPNLSAPPFIQLIEADERYQYARNTAGVLKFISPDLSNVAAPTFSLIDGRYTANLTLYMQSLLSRSRMNNGILLRLPVGGVNRLSLDASKVKLRVFYTEARN